MSDASIKISITVEGGVVQSVDRVSESSVYSSVPVIVQVKDYDEPIEGQSYNEAEYVL